MIAKLLELPAFWGVLGAFVYAAPRWLVCHRDKGCTTHACNLQFAVAVIIGAIAAAGFAPALASWLNRLHDQDVRAISTLVGVLANPVSPRVVRLLSDFVIRKISVGDLPDGA